METYNRRASHVVAPSPNKLREKYPLTEDISQFVSSSRSTIENILFGNDSRFLVITGPCSIHDPEAAYEYARKLKALQRKVEKSIFLVMRVYLEKPRTTIGWEGLFNSPGLNGRDLLRGALLSREILFRINEMGVPVATELLNPIFPTFFGGLVSWSAIGARTTESPTHREMASGLSMPVGFKNSTNGDAMTAINGIISAREVKEFWGWSQSGELAVVKTTGNPTCHLVLRGGSNRPNYDSPSVNEATTLLRKKGLSESVIIDCSHDNSGKQHEQQAVVWQDVVNQRAIGNCAIKGAMLESNLFPGNQKILKDESVMKYGVSITDACIGWDTTEKFILSAHDFFLITSQ